MPGSCPRQLPARYSGDIHCVTTWSKLGMTFDGVSVDTLLTPAAGPLPHRGFAVRPRRLAVLAATPRARRLRPRGPSRGRSGPASTTCCGDRPRRVHRLSAYPVASAPVDTGEIELTIEKLPRGEVSEFVHDVVEPGDELEVRGPIDGFFAGRDGPALLVGGGSAAVSAEVHAAAARRSGARTRSGRWSPPAPPRPVYAAERRGRNDGDLHPAAAGRQPAGGRPAPVGRRGPGGPRRRGRFVCGRPASRVGDDGALEAGVPATDQGGAVRPAGEPHRGDRR